MIRKALLCVLIAALSLSASAQTPPTPQEEVLLMQMREIAKKQGIALTPEMEALALQRMRETQASLLGLQMATQASRATATVPAAKAVPFAAAQVAAPPVSASAPSADPSLVWTFIAPPDNDPKLGGFACGIRFGFEEYGSKESRSGQLRRTGPTTAELTTLVGSNDLSIGKGVRSQLDFAVTEDPTQCAVSFTFKDSEAFTKGGKFLNLHQPPKFTSADVLVQANKFFYRPSFTSQYPAAALMANFERLGVKNCGELGVPYSRQLPREMRGDGPMYCIKISGDNIPVVPECHPYRDGTQCSVLVVLRAKRDDHTFDARESAGEFRSAVEAILNN